MLVENDADIRILTARILERGGFGVHSASCADEAFDIFHRNKKHINVLITDVVMPKISGPELANRLIKIRPELKVLYMSRYTNDKLEQYGLEVSEISYLDKPFNPAALISAANKLAFDFAEPPNTISSLSQKAAM